jgi:hypothetical protein
MAVKRSTVQRGPTRVVAGIGVTAEETEEETEEETPEETPEETQEETQEDTEEGTEEAEPQTCSSMSHDEEHMAVSHGKC